MGTTGRRRRGVRGRGLVGDGAVVIARRAVADDSGRQSGGADDVGGGVLERGADDFEASTSAFLGLPNPVADALSVADVGGCTIFSLVEWLLAMGLGLGTTPSAIAATTKGGAC